MRSMPLVLVAMLLAAGPAAGEASGPATPGPARKIILFVGDGFGPNTLALAYLYRHRWEGRDRSVAPLAMERLIAGGHMGLLLPIPDLGELVIESAGAATTLSTGMRVSNDRIGVSTEGQRLRLITQEARALGKSVGIVTTTSILHATPAAFFGHAASRADEAELSVQLIESGFEVFLGGGARSFLPDSMTAAEALGLSALAGGGGKGRRQDGRNLLQEARARGYTVVSTADQLRQAAAAAPGATLPLQPASMDGGERARGPARLLGLFAGDHPPMVLDRKAHADRDIPSLAEKVRAAIALLDADPQGFFLVVEAGKIDFAGHRNDVASLLWETMEFDEAVGVALEHARQDPSTLLLVTADHETGGMGFSYQDLPPGPRSAEFPPMIPGGAYVKHFPDQRHMAALLQQRVSFETMIVEMGHEPTAERVREVVARHTSVLLTEQKAALVAEGKSWSPFFTSSLERGWQRSSLLGLVLSEDYGVTWSSKNHTTIPVLLMGYGPLAERCQGFGESTKVHGILRAALGLEAAQD
jgi:alkaline phosphatase